MTRGPARTPPAVWQSQHTPPGNNRTNFRSHPFLVQFPPFFGRGRATGANGLIRLAFQHRYQPRHFLPLYPAHHSHTHTREGESNPNLKPILLRTPFLGPIYPCFWSWWSHWHKRPHSTSLPAPLPAQALPAAPSGPPLAHTHAGGRIEPKLEAHRAPRPLFRSNFPLSLALVDPLVQTPPPLLLRRIDRASLRTLSDVYMLSDVHMCPCTQRCLPPQRCPLAPPPQLGVSEGAPRGVCEHRQCSLIFAVSV